MHCTFNKKSSMVECPTIKKYLIDNNSEKNVILKIRSKNLINE